MSRAAGLDFVCSRTNLRRLLARVVRQHFIICPFGGLYSIRANMIAHNALQSPDRMRNSGLPAVFVFQVSGFLHTPNGLAPAATFRQVRLEPWYETTLLGRDDVREPLRGAICTIANTCCIAFRPNRGNLFKAWWCDGPAWPDPCGR
jgi:hypothetical protein